MIGMWQSGSTGSEGTESSPLASQLQQAWLQSQIYTQPPKLLKRGLATQVRDASAEKRASYQQFYQVASDLSSIVADHVGLQNVGSHKELYFHKSRHETPEFPKRPVIPQLVSYSRKIDLPQRSRSGSFSEGSSSCLTSLSSERSGSVSPPASLSPREIRVEAFNDAVDSANNDTVDLAGQTKPLPDQPLVDDIFMVENVEGKMFTLGEDYNINELNDLVEENALELQSSDPVDETYDISWTTVAFLPTEDDVTDKLIHAYTCNLNKHVTDVSQNVDSRIWVNEQDACTDHSDASWDWYLECIRAKSGRDYRLLSSSLNQDHFFDKKKLWPDDFSFTPGCIDLKGLLLRCALVVSQDDVRSANNLIRELRHHSSAHGNSLQRMAYYYMEALVAKMSGAGAQLYMAITSNTPSSATMLKAHRLFVDYSPYIKVSHFFSTKAILDAFEGAERVHLVDYGVEHGAQWPCLIQCLSQRREGPPHLRITCIDLPQSGNKPSTRVQEVGRRLAKFAKLWGVPFDFNALADKWEAITASQLCLKKDEVLAVNCQYKLRNLLDESIMAASPRKVVLDRIRSMNPKVFVMLVVNANYNAPFYMTRFRESMKYYSTMFEAMEVSMPVNDPDRVILEKEMYGREILNIVACDGLERVERAEPYRQWQTRTQRAGFSQKKPSPIIISKMQTMMCSYHKGYGVGEDGGWFLMGWKNQIVRAMTVWEPTAVTTTP